MENKKQDSGEFDTEGEIFQEKGAGGHLSEADFDTGLVMRDAYGREVKQTDSLESSWLPCDFSPLAGSANTSPFSTMSKIQLTALSSASSR